jgi:pimeloyl-ACP methyl ester carboxylesterase
MRRLAGFERRTVEDRFGRRITYVVRGAGAATALLVWLQGSGCHSLFVRAADGTVRTRQQGVLASVLGDRGNVLAVEKPGVRLFDDPGPRGTADGCRPVFRREHTLERWSAAVVAAISAQTITSPASPIVLVGQSEGGLVAATVARQFEPVSHVALLSAPGPCQLQDLVSGEVAAGDSLESVITQLRRIDRHPDSSKLLAFGHPCRRWTSFLATSSLDELLRADVTTLIVHGTRDVVAPVAGARLTYLELLRRDRPATLVEFDAGHDLFMPSADRTTALRRVFGQVVDWALDQSAAGR